MGRPKGSKNKPKPLVPVVEVKVKKVRAAKASVKKQPKVVDEPPPVPKKRGRKPKPKLDLPSEVIPTGPAFIPLNMNNFVFNEHLLLRYATYLISQMDPVNNSRYSREAADADELLTHYVIKRLLRAFNFKPENIASLMNEVINFKNNNMPSQLYIKVKRS
jgi:hypothetical protein